MVDTPNVLDFSVQDFDYRRATVSQTATVATPRQVYGITVDSVTITLDASMRAEGTWVGVKDESGAAGGVGDAITVDGGAAPVDGSTSFMIDDNFAAAILYCDGTNWFSLGGVGAIL